MPKFPKGFGRRKSSTNVFEEVADAPVEHSFKVFERPSTGSNSFDGGAKLGKAATAPLAKKPLPHLDDDNMFVNIGSNRGSGASNTNTASTTDNSSRLSAASTVASSADMHGREDWRSPHDKPFSDIPLPPVPKSNSAFSLKTAGRTLSWGRNKPMPPSPPKTSPSPTVEEERHNGRSRAVTASSYASTATPPKLEDRDLGLSLGGDFSDMFSGFGKRRSVVMDAEKNRAMSQSPDTMPSGPANRSYSSNRLNIPSALSIDKNREVEASPYSWSSQHSRDGLISSASPPPFAPRNETPPPPPVPQHSRAYTESPASFTTRQRPSPANNGLRRSSAVMEPKRQSTLEYGESVDEDARLLRESVSAARQLNDPGHRARDSWLVPSTSSYKVDESTYSSWRTPSSESTPRAKKPEIKSDEDNLFDTQIAAAANVANRYQMNSRSAPAPKNASPQNKVMTPAQFERYKQDQERLKSIGGLSKDKEEEDEDETYDDDEDEAEKAKQAAKQRRKQEAHMAVYRQQMMKVTGEAPEAAPRPSLFATQSSPNLALSGDDAEEEDEEVPLAILQAHGFPSKGKPPMRSMGSNPNLRSGSVAGVVVGNGGNLPVFARNLPQDPYFGASVVNPMHRESLSFGGGAGSVSGAAPRGLPSGGLVGVIATEERSRAMRRGSPNMQGEYGPSAPPSMNGMGMQPPQMGASMYNGMGGMPMGPMGPMNPMMLSPGDQAQLQMTQQMQQFMQMQMQFMQMMTGGAQQQNGHMPHASMGDMPRPGSAHQLRPVPPQHQRAMTMLEPNAAPWMQNRPGSSYAPSVHAQGNGYAPSIAPSERSNIGLPGRYRPVSHAPVNNENQGRTSSMSGALQNWETKNASATIKQVKKSGNVSDEDDEEGWEEMAKKREKKKSVWRIKKDTNNGSLREMLNFTSS